MSDVDQTESKISLTSIHNSEDSIFLVESFLHGCVDHLLNCKALS